MGANRIQQFNLVNEPVELDSSQGQTETAFFFEGQQVVPLLQATDSTSYPGVPDSEATTVEGLRDDYNALLGVLRSRHLLPEE